MDRLELIPMLRGAYMAALRRPVIIHSVEDGRLNIPELILPFTDTNFRALNKPNLPAAVRVKGLGSFYVGRNWEEVERAMGMSSGEPLLYAPGEDAKTRRGTIEGKVILVTGGARGLGAAIARGLVEQGAFLIVADIK